MNKKLPFVAEPQTVPQVMGIVNATPDSFSDGGQFFSPDAARHHIERLTREGADMIDLGAESTRPGAPPVSVAEEIRRLEPILRRYWDHTDRPLSVDTMKAEVAALALSYGASMINDVSAGRDPDMWGTVAKANATYVLMHMQGAPKTMQASPSYTDVVAEVTHFLREKRDGAQSAGIQTVILDPGIGFGKTLPHNLSLLRHLPDLVALGPVLLGTSRKSFIGHILDDMAAPREEGTLVSTLWGLMAGVQIVRVHDVAAIRRAFAVYAAIVAG